MMPGSANITINKLAGEEVTGVALDVLRLDSIHPVISGNKWFKLKEYLKEARRLEASAIVTFGGAYSNHIVATACAASMEGFAAIGIIRGEEPAVYSSSLKDAVQYGMQLVFLSRSEYALRKRNRDISWLGTEPGNYYVIPEGGAGEEGVAGASEILHFVENPEEYSDIVTAIGTGTTTAGIIRSAAPGQRVTGISVMKNNKALHGEIEALLQRSITGGFGVIHDYHFGGYGKYTPELLEWMNRFYHMSTIPLDFVYTGKMMYGIFDLVKCGYFLPGAKILAIHSGGLQGNRSLPEAALEY